LNGPVREAFHCIHIAGYPACGLLGLTMDWPGFGSSSGGT
jgi:hypothetical protein